MAGRFDPGKFFGRGRLAVQVENATAANGKAEAVRETGSGLHWTSLPEEPVLVA